MNKKEKQRQKLYDQMFMGKRSVMTNFSHYIIAIILFTVMAISLIQMDELNSIFEILVIGQLLVFDVMVWLVLANNSDNYASIAISLVAINSVVVVAGWSTSIFTNISLLVMAYAAYYRFMRCRK